jgi:hypothetical protein
LISGVESERPREDMGDVVLGFGSGEGDEKERRAGDIGSCVRHFRIRREGSEEGGGHRW